MGVGKEAVVSLPHDLAEAINEPMSVLKTGYGTLVDGQMFKSMSGRRGPSLRNLPIHLKQANN